MIDRDEFHLVREEWMKAAGCSLVARTTIGMLEDLETNYQDTFSIEYACEALISLASEALAVRDALKHRMVNQRRGY